jgi:hypothetical protein
MKRSGLPKASTAAWILVLIPPRERPIARASHPLTWGTTSQSLSWCHRLLLYFSLWYPSSELIRHDTARLRARSTSHPVALLEGCTNIPLAAGQAQETRPFFFIGVLSQGGVRFVQLDPPGHTSPGRLRIQFTGIVRPSSSRHLQSRHQRLRISKVRRAACVPTQRLSTSSGCRRYPSVP